ncbi:hypothetical protein [Pseudoalteromonas luteoviolacea]|uniref:hypothetical protein n=1 Tax=Pseudoalteromonas luteoviolacea TaxID=43657 RepID=UPI0006896141|nr:hypothetical protein [Pseudoalteromonas luteoviolacea]
MKYVIAFSLSFIILTGCKSPEGLAPVSNIKPGVAKEGTLANTQLILDAKVGLEKIVGTTINDSELLKFVIQQPTGKAGARSWREMWVIKKSKNTSQYLLTFKEVGLGSASFEIKQMDKRSAMDDCPQSVSDFKKGQTNLFIKGCLGEPDNINQNPDGRYIYFYYRSKGVVLTYLFNSENELIKFKAYQEKNKA